MSSKRGRKVNKDLPPSRARDVQRAFRARRAAHLEALEERVAVLEQENSVLRAVLKLPPSARPLLGRGPTGKEKPKLIFAQEGADPSLIETIRRASVSTVSTDASNVSHVRSPISATTPPYINGDNSFEFPHWDNALMIHQDVGENDRSPPVEGHHPPLKLSSVPYFSHQSMAMRSAADVGGMSPHSRSNSLSQSSSSSSAEGDAFSPVYMLNDMPDRSPSVHYSGHSHPAPSNNHVYPTEPFGNFQYPAHTGSTQQSSPYLTRRESDHFLNVSYARHSPSTTRSSPLDPTVHANGHRRAITEPHTLRALINEYSGSRATLNAPPLPSHSIRVPSPPPVPAIDRDAISRKYSLA